MSNEINILYEFGGFRFDGRTHKLWQNNELILLSPKASELLKLLLEQNGEFVSKEEIFQTVWAGTYVEDGVLTQNVYTLRKALGDNENGQPLIENRTRRGYRITAPVQLVENSNGLHKSSSPTAKEIYPATQTGVVDGEIIEKESSKRQARNWKKSGFMLAICAGLLVIAGFFGYRLLKPKITSLFRKPIENVKFQSLTNTGNVTHPAISPDGNFVAYAKNGQIYLEDLATNKEIKLTIPNVGGISSVQFSADGNFIYFRPVIALRQDANILRVSRFGGETKVIAETTWGAFGLSNDGKEIAFVRMFADQAKQVLFIKNLESGEERELTTTNYPDFFLFNCLFAWSPDNKKIAFVRQGFTSRRTGLFVIDIAGKNIEEIKTAQLKSFEQIAWLPDGETLIASANEGGKFFHLWKIFPGGDVQRITNGLNTLATISISADGKKILALQTVESSNIFIAGESNLNEQKQITSGNTNNVGQTSMEWVDENKLLYADYSEEIPMANLWSINLTDNSRQALTSNKDFHSDSATVSADGKIVYFTTTQSPVTNIWKMETNGSGLTQVTDGNNGFRIHPQISGDGKFLYYVFRNREGGGIMRLNLAEFKEESLLEKGLANPFVSLSLSPDGKYLSFINLAGKIGSENDRTNFQFGVVSTENPKDLKFFEIRLLTPNVKISPDGKAVDYVSWEEGKTMIMRKNIEGGEPKEIYTLPKGRIFNFAWSKSGKQLAISQGHQYKDAVLLTNFE